HPANLEAVLKLVQRVRQECAGKDIWLWTGYVLDELTDAQREVVDLIDALVDGKFVQEQHDPSLLWRGSANQVIHYFQSDELDC
ncbi:4Fe-4S cluster-binding domain-containing protein, partial [Photobacterium sp. OFAV2-7]|uniref:4Fe-4S cluster-binding domain-containing protein n=1 Tax=Photobacterium sp. OFAV2-7 TaxID=2917748 RepID=UPI001EF4886D